VVKRRPLFIAVAAVFLLWHTAGPAGQTLRPPTPPRVSRIPRTAEGRPDFQGVWSYATLTPLERPDALADKPFLTDEEAAEYVKSRLAALNADGRARADYNEFWMERPRALARFGDKNLTSRIIDPPDGHVPSLTAAAQQRVNAREQEEREHAADGPENRTLAERCISLTPLGFEPVGGGASNFVEIIQTPQHLALRAEMMSALRIVSITASEHLPRSVRLAFGDSRGRWEGDTLVVDTTNYTGRFQFTFLAADTNLHVVERFSLVDANTLLQETTVEDATAFTKPWTSVLPITRVDARLFEYACHEGNYALMDILSGARAEERGGGK
jgi:hypothetical protein